MGLPLTTLQRSPQVLWQAPFQTVASGSAGQLLNGAWRLLLLGDGSPTRHLELLSGIAVEIELVAMAPDPDPGPWAPVEIHELDGPLLRRQVWLRCGSQTLAWAESWWNEQTAQIHLQEREQPIWRSLTSHRAELFREVDGLAQVEGEWLAQRFGHAGPFWSRHYRFFRGGTPLTVIREVFSPALEQWLGAAQPKPDTPATADI
jgi:chorismate--pyruvate lyase